MNVFKISTKQRLDSNTSLVFRNFNILEIFNQFNFQWSSIVLAEKKIINIENRDNHKWKSVLNVLWT